jgi:hypothetical protein
MLRSIRIPILASFVALMFVACGGGTSKPNGQHDAGTDTPHIQFDAQHDGQIVQQDGGTDGTTGSCTTDPCNSSGGTAAGGWCKCTSECACTNLCANPWPTESTGLAFTCWKSCTSATDCTTGSEECFGITTSTGACLKIGTVAGTFTSLPSYLSTESPSTLGTAAVTLTLDGETVNFTVGYVDQYTWQDGSTTWNVTLMPGTTSAPDMTKSLEMMIDSASYGASTWDLAGTSSPVYARYVNATISGTTYTSYVVIGSMYGGSLSLSAAGAGGGAAVTGTLTSGTIDKLQYEICGSHSKGC